MGDFLELDQQKKSEDCQQLTRKKLVPDPQWKQVVRSSCHASAVKQEMDYHIIPRNEQHCTQAKWSWTGRWFCNSCEQYCKIYYERKRVYPKQVKIGHYECVDQVEGLQVRKQHIPDNDTKFCYCGSELQVIWDKILTEGYFSRYKASKLATFHECTSKDIATELGCIHAETCKHTSQARKAWARNQEFRFDNNKHISKCPAIVKPPKLPKPGGWNKPDLEIARHKGEEEIQQLLQGMFQDFGQGGELPCL